MHEGGWLQPEVRVDRVRGKTAVGCRAHAYAPPDHGGEQGWVTERRAKMAWICLSRSMFGMNSVEWKLAELERELVSLGHGRGIRGSLKGADSAC